MNLYEWFAALALVGIGAFLGWGAAFFWGAFKCCSICPYFKKEG